MFWSCFSISNSKLFVRTPGYFVMTQDGFSALQFVPPASKVLADSKTILQGFLFLILRLELSPGRILHACKAYIACLVI